MLLGGLLCLSLPPLSAQEAPDTPAVGAAETPEPDPQAGLPLPLRVEKPDDLADEIDRLEELIELGEAHAPRIGFIKRQRMKMAGEKIPRQVPLQGLRQQADLLDEQLIEVEGVAMPAEVSTDKEFMLGGHGGVRVRLAAGAEVIGVGETDTGLPAAGSRVTVMGTVMVDRQTTPDGSEIVRSVLEADTVAPSAALTQLQIARTCEVWAEAASEERSARKKWREAAAAYQAYAKGYRAAEYAVHALVRAAEIYRDKLQEEKAAAKAYTSAWDIHAQATGQRAPEPVVWVYDEAAGSWDTKPVRETIGDDLDEINRKNTLYQVMNAFARLARGDPAWGVILMAIVTRLLIFPLTWKQMKSAKEMQKLQPQLKELQERHKGDKGKQQKEMWKMFREKGINPLGGCWPMLVQLPILWALYRGIRMYIVQFDQTGFTIVPGLWSIANLADPDLLLLLLYTVSQIGFQLLTQRLQPPPTDAQAEQTQKMMVYMMPIMLFMIFRSLPAAFILYWLGTNVIYCVLQLYMTKRMKRQEDAVSGVETIEPRTSKAPANPGKKGRSKSKSSDEQPERKSLADQEKDESKTRRGRPRRKRSRK